MWQQSLGGDLDLMSSSVPLPRSVIVSRGIVYARPISAHRISVTDGSLSRGVMMKTPTSNLGSNGGSQPEEKRRAGGHGPTLADQVEHSRDLLPSPRVQVTDAAASATRLPAPTARLGDRSSRGPDPARYKGPKSLGGRRSNLDDEVAAVEDQSPWLAGTPTLPAPMTSYSQRTAEEWRAGRPAGNGARLEQIGDLEIMAKEITFLPTPAAGAFNDGETTESWRARQARLKARGYNRNGMGTPLTIAVQEMSGAPDVATSSATTTPEDSAPGIAAGTAPAPSGAAPAAAGTTSRTTPTPPMSGTMPSSGANSPPPSSGGSSSPDDPPQLPLIWGGPGPG